MNEKESAKTYFSSINKFEIIKMQPTPKHNLEKRSLRLCLAVLVEIALEKDPTVKRFDFQAVPEHVETIINQRKLF